MMEIYALADIQPGTLLLHIVHGSSS